MKTLFLILTNGPDPQAIPSDIPIGVSSATIKKEELHLGRLHLRLFLNMKALSASCDANTHDSKNRPCNL